MSGEARFQSQSTSWKPQSLSGANLRAEGLDVGAIELDLVVQTPVQEYVFAPKTLRYEFTFGGDNELDRKIIELQSKRRQSYTRFLADVPLYRFWGKGLDKKLRKLEEETIGLFYRYEAFAFTTEIELEEDKRFVPLTGTSVDLNAGDRVQGATVFEKHELHYRSVFEDDPSGDAWGIGLFFLEYAKPYSVEVLGNPEPETLREGRFDAFGLGFGGEFNYLADSEDHDLRLELTIDFGRGRIDFANGADIQDFIPTSKSVSYFGPSLELAHRWRLGSAVALHTTGLVRLYHFEQWPPWESDDLLATDSEKYDLNDDVVWALTVGLIVGF